MRRSAGNRLVMLLLALGLLLGGCGDEGSAIEVVVTQVVTVAGEPVEVTRVVRREIEVVVTTTPLPDNVVPDPVTLDIALTGTTGTLDPQKALGPAALTLNENLFARLTRLNPRDNTVVPALASTWQVSADGRTWTFTLRDDIYWVQPNSADPSEVTLFRPVNAGDVVFAVQRACDARTATPDIFVLYVIDGCEAVHRLPAPTDADLAQVGVCRD